VARTVDLLIAQAVKDRASDIHIEPQEDRLCIRYRIDGILQDAMSLPLNIHNQLVSRLKILGEMDIAERRRPQDGQFSVKVGGKHIDIRVATVETVYGEMMVLRILDKSLSMFTLAQLGFLPDSLEKYQQLLKSPFGMILVSGPTGSGKTTTLYASVNQLDRKENNIITIEDPVEYRFAGINQTQVNLRAGLTFASGLRATMRLDPDVILVGEIRDTDTARTATQAALTGHLVLSSVHANDTVGVLFRLIDLGVEPYLIATALVGVVAQRMVRRVCPHCRALAPADPEEQMAYEQEMEERRTGFYYGTGCNFCANTGYLGRAGVFEILVISEEIRRLLLTGAGGDSIRAQAVKDGVVPMRRDGMLKVRDGITTPREVLRGIFSVA
jgi:general secretion pathway protein E